MPQDPQTLNAASFPLWGSRLIEASAGTGKTWTIAALYLRLVLGHGEEGTRFHRPLIPSEILVMTFTRAATRELSDRIRARLLEAARCFRGQQAPEAHDSFLQGLLQDYPNEAQKNKAAWLLAMAAQSMDEASVHTIDAWCQRMLREHAFDSGSLFEEELIADEKALLLEAAQDYWRQECYAIEPDGGAADSVSLLEQILEIWPSVEELRDDVKALLGKVPAPEPEDQGEQAWQTLEQVFRRVAAEHASSLSAIRAQWVDGAQAMLEFVRSQDPPNNHGWDGRRFSIKNMTGWLDTLAAWARGEDTSVVPALKTGWTRLTPEGMQDARANGAAPMPALPAVFEEFAGLESALSALPSPQNAARLHATRRIEQRLQLLKRRKGSFGFQDMLQRLDAALVGANAESLRKRILDQYPVALIDEFQDTSPIQYRIFDQVYRTAENASDRGLFLIGDPKQSIYGFRGADIYSYLNAREATQGRHYALGVNFRSTKPLVEAVNHCFVQREKADDPPSTEVGGAFQFRSESGNPVPFVKVGANGRKEQWVQGEGKGESKTPLPPITLVLDLDVKKADDVRKLFAQRCAEQIVTWLNDPDNGFQDDQKFERLRPRDIAVLVRSRTEAAAIRYALQRRGIASVYLSDKDSVFGSDEARDLVHWLRAVATPNDSSLVRAGLALQTMGLSLARLGQIATDDDAFDAQSQVLHDLHQVWQTLGVLAMLRQSLHRFNLAALWLGRDGGERRLTNFLHLAELLQTASSELEGEQALIRWLINQIAEDADGGEEQVVRLESDSDLVKVITIHKSKGLEFPVVCLPYLTSNSEWVARFAKSAYLPSGQAEARGERELLLILDKAAKARMAQERLREDLRLLYVALTRARHGLWLGFAANDAEETAAGYLLGGTDKLDTKEWPAVLASLAAGQTGIHLKTPPETLSRTPLRRQEALPALADASSYDANFDRSWAIVSYSRLIGDLKRAPAKAASSTGELASQASALSPLQQIRPADDEVLADGGTGDRSTTKHGSELSADGPIQHRFKRGPITGNFLHAQLEWLAGEGFALRDNARLETRLEDRIKRSEHAEQASELVSWLRDVVTTPLSGPEVCLADLAKEGGTVRAEMEFWLPAREIDTQAVDALCRAHLLPGVPRPKLQVSKLHGMLMGFKDLVFTHQGRYWVLDYKSNSLGSTDADYGSDALAHAVAEHRYDVQAAIYLLALHRLLKSRMGPAYEPSEHLGGAIYLFLRGIQGPTRGASTLSPPLEFIEALDAMLEAVPEVQE